jgi:O-antigen/teichoic acid export membrane protein
VDQQASLESGQIDEWGPFMDWFVLGRSISQGTVWGMIFGAAAGLPLCVIGALPGSVVGATAGLASALIPGLVLATDAERWRLDLQRARLVGALLAAAPWVAAVVYFASSVPAVPLALLGCGIAAGLTVALRTPRILNGAPVKDPAVRARNSAP